jgi:AcrR family transcriptional regulator
MLVGSATPMPIEPLTPERRRQQTRDHLLAAAAQVFADRGFYGASLDEVAAVAGFTKGAVYSNFESKEALFLALFKANYDREMKALRETLVASDVPPEFRLSDFVALIREQTRQAGGNLGVLYQEFWLYAARNPTAREQLTRFADQNVREVAEILEAEWKRQGLEPSEPAERVARIIVVLFHGIGLLGVLQPEVVDDALIETAIAVIARGIGVDI